MHPTLARLDRLAASLSADRAVVAVLGLGSAGLDTDRFDDHSDIDCSVVVDDRSAKQRYLDDVAWMEGFGGHVALQFATDPNARKVLFHDGLFVELAVFTTDELPSIPMARARVVWERRPLGIDVAEVRRPDHQALPATAELHVQEALTNVLVGLHRELRGEHLSAARFIQGHAVDRVLALARLTARDDGSDGDAFDPFDPFDVTRRVERLAADAQVPLAEMVAGYGANRAAAAAVLRWLTDRFDANAAIVSAIGALLAEER